MKLEHVGIAVKDLGLSNELFGQILGNERYKEEDVASESVTTSFFNEDSTKIELLHSSNEESAIGKFISKRGEGIHHLAFSVDDIYAEIERLKGLGFQFVSDVPKAGADNKLICFLHPKSTNGVLIELCQEKK